VAHPVINPVGEAKSNFDFFQALALRMGFEDPPFKETCEDRIKNYLLSMGEIPEGVSVDDILEGSLVHSTRSCADGNVAECGGVKYRFAVAGDATGVEVPSLLSGGEFNDPDLQSRFALKLLTPPHIDLLNSTFGEQYSETVGELLINPEDSKLYSVEDGDCVEIYNNRGSSYRMAKVTEDTAPGVVVAEGLYWQVESGGVEGELLPGINDLTSQKTSDIGGGATFHESLVAIRVAAKK